MKRRRPRQRAARRPTPYARGAGPRIGCGAAACVVPALTTRGTVPPGPATRSRRTRWGRPPGAAGPALPPGRGGHQGSRRALGPRFPGVTVATPSRGRAPVPPARGRPRARGRSHPPGTTMPALGYARPPRRGPPWGVPNSSRTHRCAAAGSVVRSRGAAGGGLTRLCPTWPRRCPWYRVRPGRDARLSRQTIPPRTSHLHGVPVAVVVAVLGRLGLAGRAHVGPIPDHHGGVAGGVGHVVVAPVGEVV